MFLFFTTGLGILWVSEKKVDYLKTRMKTFISSEALTQFGAEKIAFLTNPDGRTDISNYRVASLITILYLSHLSASNWIQDQADLCPAEGSQGAAILRGGSVERGEGCWA